MPQLAPRIAAHLGLFDHLRNAVGCGNRCGDVPFPVDILLAPHSGTMSGMFVDRVSIECHAGDGGNGCCSFRKEAHVPRGGPDGGDGGHGGNVVITADRNLGSLGNLVGHHHWRAERGQHGMGSLKTGRSAQDTVILVPPGTLVKDAEHGHLLKDLQQHGESVTVAKAGRGGRGNKRFATSTNRAPRECEPGEAGEVRMVHLELKLIADVGLVGKPNAGKSTLLSRVSRATPEIADYPFTTKYPNLGVVRLDIDREFVLADIPGLIEGAHSGAGLGHEFLKHVERTRLIVHMVEPSPMDQSDPLSNYDQIREELEKYNPVLASRPEILCVTKAELPDAETCAELLRETSGRDVHLISAVTGQGLTELNNMIMDRLAELKQNEGTADAEMTQSAGACPPVHSSDSSELPDDASVVSLSRDDQTTQSDQQQ